MIEPRKLYQLRSDLEEEQPSLRTLRDVLTDATLINESHGLATVFDNGQPVVRGDIE